MSYAVIDFETTGFVPERTDRVLEIGVVLSDDHGVVEHEWTTLINPRRDVGAAHVHGIRSADLVAAPEFGDVAGHLMDLLDGRTVVAHNASFDMRFLRSELARVDHRFDDALPALCSMKWAGRSIGAAKLAQCCEALGIELTDAHTALADARATNSLLTHLQRMVGQHPEWVADRQRSAGIAWPRTTSSGNPAPRAVGRGAGTSDPHAWLRTVLQAAWVPGDPEDEASYLLTLERALLDRHISATEGAELRVVAESAGITRETVTRLHHDYLRAVAVEALGDGVVTEQERVDLESIATALGFGSPYVDEALTWASAQGQRSGAAAAFTLTSGDRIVFTGDMVRPRDQWVTHVVAAGLSSGGVTKATKVVVAGDPDSMSGKAAKARAYGVPVITEAAFERFFNLYLQNQNVLIG